jgi:hypothetical protein
MSKAKVTQEQADAYMDGWGAHHNGQAIHQAMESWGKYHPKSVRQCFFEGYEDSSVGSINFDKIMGPNDFEPDVP